MRDVRALDRRIADLDERIRQEVEASGTTLTEVFGVGSILAAKIIAIVGDVARFPSKGHFASSEEASIGATPPLRRGSQAPALASWEPQTQQGAAHDRGLPGSQRYPRRSLPP